MSDLLMTQSPVCGATAETVTGSQEQCEGSDLIVRERKLHLSIIYNLLFPPPKLQKEFVKGGGGKDILSARDSEHFSRWSL